MDHPIQLSWALAGEPVWPYRGPISTSGIENLRDGDGRRQRGALCTHFSNDGWNWPTGGAFTAARAAHNAVFAKLDTSEVQHKDEFQGAGHIIGTCRMGADAKTSVVDANLRAHDHPNLYMVGSAVSPHREQRTPP